MSSSVPTLAGLALLVLAARAGALAVALAALPAALLVAGGTRSLFAPDLRAPQQAATGAGLAVLLALPLGLAGGAGLGAAALVAGALSFVAAGWRQISLQPRLEEVPAPAPSPGYAARVALDDAVLNAMTLAAPLASPEALGVAARESEAADALYAERGWHEAPLRFHAEPPALEKPSSQPLRVRGLDCEHLRWESGFEPHPGLPGRERWLGHRANHQAHAWLLRQRAPAPWLVCVHGFGMGTPELDFRSFRVGALHHGAGLNVATVSLPVHGPRAPGRFNGREFMGLSPLDFVHAEAQAVWDLRRLIGWLRRQEGTSVGVFGISLGGYTTGVLAGVEDGLACAIAGIPPADLIATGQHLASSLERRRAAAAGADVERDRRLHRVVSPLALAPRLARERRFVFAATGDQFVPIEQVRALWLHWERPRIHWCTGGHLSALMQSGPRRLVDEVVSTHLAPAPNAVQHGKASRA